MLCIMNLYKNHGILSKINLCWSARQELIVRLPSLTSLNGSEFKAKERIDIERMYLTRCMKAAMITLNISSRDEWELLPVELRKTHLSATFPRFNELVEIHGLPLVAKRSLEGSTLGSNSVTLKLRSMAAASITMDVKEKKLPLSTTVSNLKLIFKRYD